jgi:hypothetical protein
MAVGKLGSFTKPPRIASETLSANACRFVIHNRTFGILHAMEVFARIFAFIFFALQMIGTFVIVAAFF